MTEPTHILCKKCGQTKPASEFFVNRANRTGRQVYCKPCWKEYTAPSKRAWDQKHIRRNVGGVRFRVPREGK